MGTVLGYMAEVFVAVCLTKLMLSAMAELRKI